MIDKITLFESPEELRRLVGLKSKDALKEVGFDFRKMLWGIRVKDEWKNTNTPAYVSDILSNKSYTHTKYCGFHYYIVA